MNRDGSTLAALLIAVATAGLMLWLGGLVATFVVAIALGVILALLVRRAPATTAPVAPPSTEERAGFEPLRELVRMLDGLGEGVLLLGEEQVVLAANEAAALITGRPPDAMTGVSLIRAARDHELVQLLRESTGHLREVTVGEGRVVIASAVPLQLGPVRTLLTMQDVTALRRAERARADLVANVSHELRTPIAASLALAETLEEGVDDPEQAARFHRRLTQELERLRDMVERLLRLSRIESHAEQFRSDAIVVGGLLREAIDRMTPVAERAHVRLVAEPVSGESAVRGDRDRIVEVLTNLLDNAIRFSPEGGTVTLAVLAEGTQVQFSIRDEGPGILPPERQRIFERFYTGERSRTGGGAAGTGLGLAIARNIISRLGGEIWVAERTPGATLCFTLPAVELTGGNIEIPDTPIP